MLERISREECLKRFPDFPLRDYDEVRDEETFFYPEVISGRWMELDTGNDEELTAKLPLELTKLFHSLSVEQLIFLGDTDQSWISGQGLKRDDYPPFAEAVRYFVQQGIDVAFNGGVLVQIDDLNRFLTHFYTLVRCDASLPYFHFMDDRRRFLCTIHYSGQVRIDRFDPQADALFHQHISNANFRT